MTPSPVPYMTPIMGPDIANGKDKSVKWFRHQEIDCCVFRWGDQQNGNTVRPFYIPSGTKIPVQDQNGKIIGEALLTAKDDGVYGDFKVVDGITLHGDPQVSLEAIQAAVDRVKANSPTTAITPKSLATRHAVAMMRQVFQKRKHKTIKRNK